MLEKYIKTIVSYLFKFLLILNNIHLPFTKKIKNEASFSNIVDKHKLLVTYSNLYQY